jgi:hypothetical protein
MKWKEVETHHFLEYKTRNATILNEFPIVYFRVKNTTKEYACSFSNYDSIMDAVNRDNKKAVDCLIEIWEFEHKQIKKDIKNYTKF